MNWIKSVIFAVSLLILDHVNCQKTMSTTPTNPSAKTHQEKYPNFRFSGPETKMSEDGQMTVPILTPGGQGGTFSSSSSSSSASGSGIGTQGQFYPYPPGYYDPSSYSFNLHDHAAGANNLFIDFLYDYYEHAPFGQLPPDYGWIKPTPIPPNPTTEIPPEDIHGTEEPDIPMSPSPMMPMYPSHPPHHQKPHKPKPPHHHKPSHKPHEGHDGAGNEGTKDSTDEDDSDGEDEDNKTNTNQQQRPQSPFQFMGAWVPSYLSSLRPGAAISQNQFHNLKHKWNSLLEKLKIRDQQHNNGQGQLGNGGTRNPQNPNKWYPVPIEPIRMTDSGLQDNSGHHWLDFPQSSSTNGKFQLEQLPGWNRPPLKNPQTQTNNRYQQQNNNQGGGWLQQKGTRRPNYVSYRPYSNNKDNDDDNNETDEEEDDYEK